MTAKRAAGLRSRGLSRAYQSARDRWERLVYNGFRWGPVELTYRWPETWKHPHLVARLDIDRSVEPEYLGDQITDDEGRKYAIVVSDPAGGAEAVGVSLKGLD